MIDVDFFPTNIVKRRKEVTPMKREKYMQIKEFLRDVIRGTKVNYSRLRANNKGITSQITLTYIAFG